MSFAQVAITILTWSALKLPDQEYTCQWIKTFCLFLSQQLQGLMHFIPYHAIRDIIYIGPAFLSIEYPEWIIISNYINIHLFKAF